MEVRNKKQQLRNDLIDFLADKELSSPSGKVTSTGEGFVSCLVSTLWYIDGQHHVFNDRSYRIPVLFEKCTGYNTPEASKYRKRSLQNMTGSTLHDHSNDLFSYLQSKFWENSGWAILKPDIEMLVTSISNYATYLLHQNERAKHIHSSIQPPRNAADHLVFQFLPHGESMSLTQAWI